MLKSEMKMQLEGFLVIYCHISKLIILLDMEYGQQSKAREPAQEVQYKFTKSQHVTLQFSTMFWYYDSINSLLSWE